MWEKREWLQTQAAHYDKLRAEAPQRRLVSGETVPFLGGELVLVVRVEAGRRRVHAAAKGGELAVRLPEGGSARAALERWYREQARKFFAWQVEILAERLGCRVGRVTIGDHRTQWGSCGPGGRVSFNWRLMLAPEEAAIYVAAHEVAHMKHRNHSRFFWQTVERLYPDWRRQRQWLKDNEHRLVL